jgi:hypothetical protein
MRTAICLLALLLTACPSGDDDDFAGCVDSDRDSYCDGADCDDSNAAVHPDATELCNDVDDDCDGVLGLPETTDADSDGVAVCRDCNDEDGTMFPGNPEVCDGFDNDCDGTVPVDEADGDFDGHLACVDCNDGDSDIFPGGEEVACDGVDSNCDGVLDVMEEDGDGDGYTGCDGDCGPDNPDIHPDADEGCNTIDNDCDGSLGAGEADNDGDGHLPCDDDCDDNNASVHPDAGEQCDGIDNDCNGLADGTNAAGSPETQDDDADGFTVCGDDCDDSDPSINPAAPELCDGVDNDCNGASDWTGGAGLDENTDADGDAWTLCGGDCDDEDPNVSPAQVELCDGLDTDCNGLADFVDAAGNAEDQDADADGFSACMGDCDDADPSINPDGYDLPGLGDGNCDGVDGSASPGIEPRADAESDILDSLDFECSLHGLALTHLPLEYTGPSTQFNEAQVFASAMGTGGPGVVSYTSGTAGVLPRSAPTFAYTGTSQTLTLEFTGVQTMVAFAVISGDSNSWPAFSVTLSYDGTDLGEGPLYAGVDPGSDWAFRGWRSLDDLGFDTLTVQVPFGDEPFYLDDIWLCD